MIQRSPAKPRETVKKKYLIENNVLGEPEVSAYFYTALGEEIFVYLCH